MAVDGYFTYSVTNNEATVTYFAGPATADVPSTLGGYPVVAIGEYAFQAKYMITSITLPSSVITIGTGAFLNCVSLVSISINGAITTIPSNAFESCSALTSINIPTTVTSIGSYAFYYCISLTNVTIPDSVVTIGNGAFQACQGLVYITIGAGVTTFGYSVFYGCISLISLTFIGLVAPTSAGTQWIEGANGGVRGHALSTSNFPTPGNVWNPSSNGELLMGSYSIGAATIPSSPTGLATSIGNEFVTITWLAPSVDGGSAITQYIIYRSNASGGVYTQIGTSNVLSYTNSGLVNNITYYYEISAVNSVGEGNKSNYISGIPLGYTVPGAPTTLVATPSSGEVALSWTAPSDGGSAITKYSIYRSISSTGVFTIVIEPTTTSGLDVGLTNNTTYWYKVTATNAYGEGDFSTLISTIPISTEMDAPINVTLSVKDINNVISWDPPATTPWATSYNVYMGGTDDPNAMVKMINVPANKRKVMHVAGEQGAVYYYAITSVEDNIESDKSDLVFNTYNTRVGNPRSKVISMSNIVRNGSFDLDTSNWTNDAGTIEALDNSVGGFTFEKHALVSDSLIKQSINITPGHTYIYVVRGKKDSGSRSPAFYIWNDEEFAPKVKVPFTESDINIEYGVYTPDDKDIVNGVPGINYGVGGVGASYKVYPMSAQHSQGWADAINEGYTGTETLFARARAGNYDYGVPDNNYGSLGAGNKEPSGLDVWAYANGSEATVRRGFVSFIADANVAYATSASLRFHPSGVGQIPHLYIVRNYGSWLLDDSNAEALFYNASTYRGDDTTSDEDFFGEIIPSGDGTQFDVTLNDKGIEYIRQTVGTHITFAIRCDADYFNDFNLAIGTGSQISLDENPVELLVNIGW